jgi:hypothetical protein
MFYSEKCENCVVREENTNYHYMALCVCIRSVIRCCGNVTEYVLQESYDFLRVRKRLVEK